MIFSAFLVFGVFSFVKSTSADINQQILDLRAQVDALTKQAEQYKNNIAAKQKEANTLSRQISILNNQIAQLQTEIAITSNQISTIKLEIADLEQKIFEAQDKINRDKAAIAKLIMLIDDRDHQNMVAVLIKNPTLAAFSDAVQQDNALNQNLNEVLVIVKNEKDKLQADKTALEDKKTELESLNDQQLQQKDEVQNTRQDKDQLLKVTKGKEQEYQNLLASVEKNKRHFLMS